MKLFIAAFIFLSSNLNLYSNNSDTIIASRKKTIIISDTTHYCMVLTLSKTVHKKVNLCGLRDSSVKILDNNYSHDLAIDSIQSITFYGRGFLKGAAIGGSIGMLTGIIFGGYNISITGDGSSGDYNFGKAFALGFVIGVPFALIGGGVGALLAEDNFYDLSKMNFTNKRKKLIYLMKEYSDK
ncbi:MAG: hypothetical protein ABI840_08595 [bacterium]